MATINSLPQATALESTDKLLIETLTVPKSISGAVLKEQITADSLKKGRVRFNEPDGMQEAIISVQIGKRYEVYLNSRFEQNPDIRHGRQIISVVVPPNPDHPNYSDNFSVPVFVQKSINPGESANVPAKLSFFGSLAEKSITVYYHNTGSETAQEELYIYKIIEYDEV